MSADALAANLGWIEDHIESACNRAGRERSEITLIAVSKTFPPDAVERAIGLGVHEIGENRIQEMETKKPLVSSPARWHMIGHLQSNKARQAVRLADVIQTVDSERLARRLSAECAMVGRTLDVLLQVNMGHEPQKSGIDPDRVEGVLRAVASLSHLRPIGLMTIPPAQSDPRPHFSSLRALRDTLNRKLQLSDFVELSMGMSEDFEVAIEEGATMIRLGRSVFGERP